MENSERTTGVRKYRKSSVPRLRWTSDLHDHFVEAVRKLGGKNKATPKRIMQMMGVRGLKMSHIKSHLQMYRTSKKSMDSDKSIAIKNYQEKQLEFFQLLPLLHVSQAPNHRTRGRRKTTQIGETLLYHDHEYHYQVQGKKGRSYTEGVGMTWNHLPAPDIKPLNSNSYPINLDLTISYPF